MNYCIVVLALCTLFRAGSTEICYSCFTAVMSESHHGEWGRNETTTYWPESPDCYHPDAYEGIECLWGSGCEKISAEVEFYYEGEFSSFNVMYLGCGNSTATINGCTFEPHELYDYLYPFKTGIDNQFGLTLDWDAVRQGQACRCSGDFCNGATYVKMSGSLMVLLSLVTFVWNRF